MTKDRALLGFGSEDSTSLVMATGDAGIRTGLGNLAVPRGMATYTAGVTYFHGGLSPQECILPVIDALLKPSSKIAKAQRIEINLTYRGSNRGTVTTLMPSMELSYPAADLFGPPNVRLILVATNNVGKTVGEAASSSAVDPVSREINLERGKAIKVPLRLQDGFEGEFKVMAADPTTGAAYATVKLKTDFHH
jgi:hypothetical protein